MNFMSTQSKNSCRHRDSANTDIRSSSQAASKASGTVSSASERLGRQLMAVPAAHLGDTRVDLVFDCVPCNHLQVHREKGPQQESGIRL